MRQRQQRQPQEDGGETGEARDVAANASPGADAPDPVAHARPKAERSLEGGAAARK